MKTSKLLTPLIATAFALAALIGSFVATHKIAIPGDLLQVIVIAQGMCILGVLGGVYATYTAMKDARLRWEQRTVPPTTPGKYLVRFDEKEATREVIVRQDGKPYARRVFTGGDPDLVTDLNKPMEWAKVG